MNDGKRFQSVYIGRCWLVQDRGGGNPICECQDEMQANRVARALEESAGMLSRLAALRHLIRATHAADALALTVEKVLPADAICQRLIVDYRQQMQKFDELTCQALQADSGVTATDLT